jgi:hypothetical protein
MPVYADIERRRGFPGGTLAYSGGAVYVNEVIEALTGPAAPRPHPADLHRLIQAVEGLARARL